MKKWLNATASLFSDAGAKIGTVPERAVVYAHGETALFAGTPREFVVYRTANATLNGWVYTGYLEPYVENYPVGCVPVTTRTPNPADAEQYAMIYGVLQTNLCGELCAAYLLGISLEDLLAKWEVSAPSVFRRVFNWLTNKKASGTGTSDLQSMLAAFGAGSILLTDALRDPILKRTRYTADGLLKLAGRAIVSVNIDGATGRLRGSGVAHWVVVTRVIPERCGYGLVEVYNPFPDRVEVYSWAEFIASAREPYGVVKDA